MTAPLAVSAVAEVLEWLGANQWMILAVTALFALYHFRSTLQIASQVATVLKVVAVLGAVLLVASAGLVPGFDIIVEVETLGGWLLERARDAWGVLEGFL